MPQPRRRRRQAAHVEKQPEAVTWWQRKDAERKEKRGHFGKPLTFDEPTANVNVNLHGKVNLGNYESADFGVSLTLPCRPTPKAVELAYRTARAFCEEKMEELVGQLRGGGA